MILTYQEFEKHQSDRARWLGSAIAAWMKTDEYKMAVEADQYDKQRNTAVQSFIKKVYDITGIASPDFTSRNNRISSNFFHRLLTQRCSYSLGNGVSFAGRREEAKPDGGKTYVDPTKDALGKTFDRKLKETAAAAQENVNNPAEGADLEALNTALADANAAVEAAQAALADAEARKAKAEEVYALATAEGADFDALISEYNDDPGASTYPDGYFISTSYASNYVTEFADAAMALENVGDISGIVETDYGYHIIQYAADYTTDSATMQEQRDALKADLLSSAQDTALQTAYQEWESAAKVNLYLDRLN